MEHNNRTTHTNAWKFVTVLLLVIGIGLIAGILYINRERALSQARVIELTSERDQAQRQLAVLNSNNVAIPTDTTANTTYTSPKGVSITVSSPAKNATVSSPIKITGKVPGNWSNEAQFTILLKASDGTIMDQASAQLDGSWMTSAPVVFNAELTYSGNRSGNATIVLQKANPSGLPANDDHIEIPVNL